MARDEVRRHELFVKLQQVLGADEAATLMESLPPDRWDELATKADVHRLSETLELRMESLEHRLVGVFRGELNAAITAQTRSIAFAMASVTVSVSALAFAAARLT